MQRKGKNPKEYGVGATFLPGHFKGYTVKLNPLDGVYYFDIRPTYAHWKRFSKIRIRTFDNFLFKELWAFLKRKAVIAKIEPEEI